MWWKVASIGGTATNDTPPNNALQRTPSARAGACFVLAPWPSAPLKASVGQPLYDMPRQFKQYLALL